MKLDVPNEIFGHELFNDEDDTGFEFAAGNVSEELENSRRSMQEQLFDNFQEDIDGDESDIGETNVAFENQPTGAHCFCGSRGYAQFL